MKRYLILSFYIIKWNTVWTLHTWEGILIAKKDQFYIFENTTHFSTRKRADPFLTHLIPPFSFYTRKHQEKHQKTSGLLMFWRGIEKAVAWNAIIQLSSASENAMKTSFHIETNQLICNVNHVWFLRETSHS